MAGVLALMGLLCDGLILCSLVGCLVELEFGHVLIV